VTLLDRLALLPAALKKRPRHPGIDPIELRLELGPGVTNPLKLTLPLLWQGESAPLAAFWPVDGPPPEDLAECNLVVLDLAPSGVPRRLDMDHPRDLRLVVELLRQGTADRVPVLVRLVGGDLVGDMPALLEAEPDGVIVVEGDVPLPAVLAASRRYHARLPLLAARSTATAEEALKLMALGVVGVALEMEMEDDALRALARELALALGRLGLASAADLGIEHLRALDQDAAALTGVPLAGYDAVLPMWRH